MPDRLPLEKKMVNALKVQLESALAEGFAARYFNAKAMLFEKILPWIGNNQPDLTDHGPGHVVNVLQNAHKLIFGDSVEGSRALGSDEMFPTGINLYCLCQACLFHDVGNFVARSEHEKLIQPILSGVLGILSDRQELAVIARAGRAHTGWSPANGTRDVLKDLDEAFHVAGEGVQLRSIAAIVRFADELAEGPHRTSRYMIENHAFPEGDAIHHKYADCTHIRIDREGERIVVDYNIPVQMDAGGRISDAEAGSLRQLITFAYRRLEKLEQERRYARYYCSVLNPFKSTTASLRFWGKAGEFGIDLPPLRFTDLMVPGDPGVSVERHNPMYVVDAVLDLLMSRVYGGSI